MRRGSWSKEWWVGFEGKEEGCWEGSCEVGRGLVLSSAVNRLISGVGWEHGNRRK